MYWGYILRRLLKSGAMTFFSLVAGASYAQDNGVGTPVITPPMLEVPQSSNDLIVPPFPPVAVQPPVAAEMNAVAPQPSNAPVVPAAQQPGAQQPPVASAPPAVASPAADSAISKTAFSDWRVECFDPAKTQPSCQATHRVVAGDGSQVVMVFAIAATAETTSIQIALPLGISLEAAAQLIVGSGYQNKIEIGRCTPQGCIIEGTVSAELLAAMRREKSGLIVVENEKDEKIELPFSLLGFTDAYASLLANSK